MEIKVDKSKRYCPPTKIDLAPFGTIYSVIVDDTDIPRLYIQSNYDADSPRWERLGNLLEVAIANNDRAFIDQCFNALE